MEYDNLHNIVSKEQLHQKAPGQSGGIFTDILATTYRLDYAYEANNKPQAPRTIIDKPYTTSTGNDVKTKTYDYDANGNLTAITQKTGDSDVVEKLRTNLWDEENRLRAVDITPDAEGVRPIAIYTYDAGGERILKHSNTSVSIYLNGKKVADTIQTDATLYPSGMLVARVIPSDSEESTGGLGYTKHYYAGTQRVSSKIGTTENLGDYLQDWFTQGTGGPIDVIGSSFGVLENAEQGVDQVYDEFGIDPPTYDSSPVFIPVQSFVHGGNEVEQYFFHPDHLGSTSYITNLLGEVSQHMEYFAFGETFVEEHRSSNNSPYKFNGKELDEETGLYYYGARYYDPRVSVWLSVDPLAEQAPNWTPYRYGFNNPIRYTDPTGLWETDYINIDTGEKTRINDGKDQVIAASTYLINSMLDSFDNDREVYDLTLNTLENSKYNLNMTSEEFMFFAETLYAESSGGYMESLGIVNVLENRASNEGTTILDQLSASPPYGVYGIWKTSKGKNSNYKYAYQNETGYGVEQKKKNIHRAIAVGLITDIDVSNGAYFWDGIDIKTNSHYKKWGLKFSDPLHNLWGLKETSGASQLITTQAIGETTFSKFLNQGTKWYLSK